MHPKVYSEDDIVGLTIKGDSVFEKERRSAMKLKGTEGNDAQVLFWMQNHVLNEDLEGESESRQIN